VARLAVNGYLELYNIDINVELFSTLSNEINQPQGDSLTQKSRELYNIPNKVKGDDPYISLDNFDSNSHAATLLLCLVAFKKFDVINGYKIPFPTLKTLITKAFNEANEGPHKVGVLYLIDKLLEYYVFDQSIVDFNRLLKRLIRNFNPVVRDISTQQAVYLLEILNRLKLKMGFLRLDSSHSSFYSVYRSVFKKVEQIVKKPLSQKVSDSFAVFLRAGKLLGEKENVRNSEYEKYLLDILDRSNRSNPYFILDLAAVFSESVQLTNIQLKERMAHGYNEFLKTLKIDTFSNFQLIQLLSDLMAAITEVLSKSSFVAEGTLTHTSTPTSIMGIDKMDKDDQSRFNFEVLKSPLDHFLETVSQRIVQYTGDSSKYISPREYILLLQALINIKRVLPNVEAQQKVTTIIGVISGGLMRGKNFLKHFCFYECRQIINLCQGQKNLNSLHACFERHIEKEEQQKLEHRQRYNDEGCFPYEKKKALRDRGDQHPWSDKSKNQFKARIYIGRSF
jgi:hypothetical protein